MSLLPNFIQRLKATLESKGGSAANGLYTDYVAGMSRAVDRAERCAALVESGHFSAALYFAKQEVDLLPLFEAWTREKHDAVLSCVNGAAQETAPYFAPRHIHLLRQARHLDLRAAGPLKQYRIAALIRKELKVRVKLLHELRRADPSNSQWILDAKELEPRRLEEIEREAKEAVAAGDEKTLADLDAELNDDWITPIPPRVSKLIRGALEILWNNARTAKEAEERRQKTERDKLDQAKALERLKALAPQLLEAFAARDAKRGFALRDQWNSAAEQCDPHNPKLSELQADVAEALEWLQSQDELDIRCDTLAGSILALDRGLNQDLPDQQIDALANPLAEITPADPRFTHRPELKTEYDRVWKRKEDLLGARRAAKFRYYLAGAAAILLLCAGIGYLVWSIQGELRVAAAAQEHAETLNRLVEEDQLPEAKQLLERLEKEDPDVAATPVIRDAAEAILRAQSQETKRLAELDQGLTRLRSLPAVELNLAEIEALEGLCKTALERAQVQALKDARTAALAAKGQARETAFADRLLEMETRSKNWGTGPGQDLPQPAALSALEGDARNLRSDMEGIPQDLRTKSDALMARIAEWQQLSGLERKEAADMARITAAIGDKIAFADELKRFIVESPGVRAENLRTTLTEARVWDEWAAWNSAVSAWNQKARVRFDAVAAKELLAAFDAAQAVSAQSPGAMATAHLRPFLEAMAKQEGEVKSPLIPPLSAMFDSQDQVVGLWVVETSGNRRYYVRDEIDLQKGAKTAAVDYLTGVGAANHKLIRLDKGEIVRHARSSQWELSRWFEEHKKRLGSGNWDDWFLELLTKVAGRTDMDPLLRAIMVSKICAQGMEGSHPMRLILKRPLESLEDGSLNYSANWLDPDDRAGRHARELAAQRLSSFTPAIPSYAKQVRDADASWRRPISYPSIWSGWLMLDSKGTWRCHVKPNSAAPSGTLWVFLPHATGATRPQMIGKLESNLPALDPSARSTFREGRPVFLLAGPGK